jgi:poly(hydroxyalkanoate) granule-associated protein
MNMKQIREAAQDLPAEVATAGRQVWLAGLGAAGIVTTGGQAVFSMLVEEGRRVKALKMVEDAMDKAVDAAVVPVKQAVKNMDKTVTRTTRSMLAKLGVPSRQEVFDLTDRVEALITKVEHLNRPRRRMAKKGVRRAH